MTTKLAFNQIKGNVVNVKDYGATGDGVTDDTTAIQTAVLAGQGGTIFFPKGTYRIASAPTTSGSDTYYFQITGDNTSIKANNAVFSLEYDFLTNTTTGSLFNINSATDVCIDSIYATASETTSQVSYGYNAVLINNGSKNIEIGQIYSENAVNGFVVTDTGANYRASARYSATTASSNIHVGNVYVKNDTTGGNLSTVGYGVSLSHSGNNTTIDNVRCINTLRACFLYGVHDVRMNVWSTDTAAAGLNLGSFASVENIDIHYREDGQENSGSHAASNIAQINAKEKSTLGGGSNDLGADTPRAHIIRNVNVHFDVDVANRSSLCFLGKEADNPASEDTAEGIIISDIKFSGRCSGVTSGLRLADAAATTPTGWTNTSFRNIVVEDYVSEDINNTLTMRSGFQNSPVIRNVRARGFNCGNEVAGTTNTYPVVYENARLDRLAKAAQDVFIHGINSHFNVEQQAGSNGIVQPYETVLTNTRIGGSAPITKKRYDVYTFVNSSTANYSPSDAMDGVVGGANLNNGSDATNLTLSLVSASGSRTSDLAVYEIDFKSFGTVDTYGARNTKRFKLYASNSAGTASAIFHGHIVVEGSLAGEDFTTATVVLDKEVTNIVGSSYVAGDLTVSTPDATTLRFTMSRSSRYLNVLIYD